MKTKRKGKNQISKHSKFRQKQKIVKKSLKSRSAARSSNRSKSKKSAVLRAQNKNFSNHLRKMAQKTANEENDSDPSTSRRATSSRSPFHSSPIKRKPFVKFKDNKHREELMQKYKLKAKQFVLGLKGQSSPSLAQATSKKILNQIKKRNHRASSGSPAKSNMSNRAQNNHQRLTENEENADDDCICVENKPEIILIDDETPAPLNVVEELKQKYLKFKHYEPIGSIRLNQIKINHNHILTSTPNPNRLNGRSDDREPFNQETDSSFGSLTSATICCNSDDVTIVEDVLPQPIRQSDVIVIDDTIVPRMCRTPKRASKRSRSNNNNNDDSVIFVSSSKKSPDPAPAFIPLNTPVQEIQVKLPTVVTSSPRPKKQRKNDLFTTREEKQLKQYNDNAYNPNKDTSKEEIPTKRMVIVDGSNVAYQHALNKEFSVKGLKICLDYFDKMGYEVKAVVPQYRLQRARSSDPAALETLHKEGKIVFTPCKNLPGKSSTSYDDRFILQLASELDAAVVSNDNYRDLIHENSALKKIIENRVIGYTWCNDVFILPKDPYGKFGPSLASILNRS